MNGPLECRLLRIDLEPRWFAAPRAGAGMGGTGRAPAADDAEARQGAKSARQAARAATAGDAGAVAPRSADAPNEDPASSPSRIPTLTPAGEQFANRLRKNLRHWGRLMRRAGVTCYRVYDADLPDFAVAVDLYERWAHVQEYEAPPEIDPAKAAQRLEEALRIVPEVLSLDPGDVFLKVRKRQRGAAQYERQAATGAFHEVHEGDCRFLVNFTDYLDTGLFPQGREVRRLIGGLARGRRFLNLFGYTGAASVAAAKGGAATTTTVDLSPHYVDWARRNFELNKMRPARNVAVEADVLEWVTRPLYDGPEAPGEYDLIYLDPPTFSNSKKMGRSTFEAQRDHADLIAIVCRRLLAPGGIMVFATNFRRFKLDDEKLGDFHLEDLSRATLPRDYERSARTHNVWKITAKA